MYFADKEHKKNYLFLMEKYQKVPGKDVQYESNIYISSFPEIFSKINMNNLPSSSPLFTLASWDDKEDRHVFDDAGLTGTTRRMCEFGASLFNGYEVRLDEVFGTVLNETLIRVLFQSMEIRARDIN